jgi:hypothetical protein
LTQITDEILRGGGRLAYEVEVLRGEAVGLSDTLTEALHDDIRKFVPEGLDEQEASLEHDNTEWWSSRSESPAATATKHPKPQTVETVLEPQYITQLRTLNQVRARLEEVIHTFGEAMEWPLPPSEVSVASSFISVSAPEPGPESHSREEKGREVAKRLRAEIINLLHSNGGGEAGLEAASRRVASLRLLATVWKGTAEERSRNKFVDSLEKLVEERRKVLSSDEREKGQKEHRRGAAERLPVGSPSKSTRPSTDQTREDRAVSHDGGGGGLFRNLQRLRDEIYLD